MYMYIYIYYAYIYIYYAYKNINSFSTVTGWDKGNDFSSLGNEPLHWCVYRSRVLQFIGFLLKLKLTILKVFSNTSVISVAIEASFTILIYHLDDPDAVIFRYGDVSKLYFKLPSHYVLHSLLFPRCTSGWAGFIALRPAA